MKNCDCFPDSTEGGLVNSGNDASPLNNPTSSSTTAGRDGSMTSQSGESLNSDLNNGSASPESVEHRLEWTLLHKSYRQLFEGQAQEVLRENGYIMAHVLDSFGKFRRDHTVEKGEEDPFTAPDFQAVLDALTASEDYLSFFKYMQSVKMRKKWAKSIIGNGPGGEVFGL